MLQKFRDQPVAHDVTDSDFSSPTELLNSIIDFLRRQFPIIAFVAAIAIALGIFYLITTPASYTAQARMIIDTRRLQTSQLQSLSYYNPVDSGMVDSQVEILRSENISLAVIKQLHLTADSEFVGSSGGLIGAVFGFVGRMFPSDTAPSSEFQLTRQAVAAFASRLTARRVGLSYIIQVSFQSQSPERAAEITNAVVDAYITDQLDAKFEATKRAGVWLQDRLRTLREQASAAERAVVQYKRQNNIVTTGTNGQLMDQQQVGELNSQLVVAQTQMSEARARLDRVQAVLAHNSSDVTLNSTVTDTLKNDVITKLRSHYLDLAAREADWAARYGNDHLAVVGLRNQMREAQNSILDELRQIGETYKSDFAIASQRVQEIQTQLAKAVDQSQTTNQAEVTLRELESTAKSYQTLYDNFLQRYMDSVQQESFPITEARVVTPASRPMRKSEPNTLLVLGLSGFGGLLLGLGLARIRDLSDRVFRTSKQLEASLQLDCIAMVPKYAPDQEGRISSPKPPPSLKSTAGNVTTIQTVSPASAIIDAPLSRYTESIRSIKLAIDLSQIGKARTVIGITSAMPDEGKSSVALSLSRLIAHTGASVLLLDCDLRNPALTRATCPGAKNGILDVLANRCTLADALWTDPATGLSVLPGRARGSVAHTTEILSSTAMQTLIERCREKYQYVIVDLSPLAPVTDVRATPTLIDSYVFVVEWGRTPIGAVEQALTSARGVYDKTLGAILNKTDMNTLQRYEGYRGSYYYHPSYSRYHTD